MVSLFTVVLVIGSGTLVYVLVMRPAILTWGATEEEARMPLPGDELAPWISSTRAITIDAPVSEVWTWVIQLGADRAGFFSYALIERALGYEKRSRDAVAEFRDMEVGRIVPASIEESKSVITYNFPVVGVQPGESFVLQNWGTFRLRELGPDRTRLIVRTHGRDVANLRSRLVESVGVPAHHLMERRMLMGLKARAEAGAGVRLSNASDNLWLAEVFLSGIGVALLMVVGGGVAGAVSSVLLGVAWLWVVLVADPRPVPALGVLIAVSLVLAWLR